MNWVGRHRVSLSQNAPLGSTGDYGPYDTSVFSEGYFQDPSTYLFILEPDTSEVLSVGYRAVNWAVNPRTGYGFSGVTLFGVVDVGTRLRGVGPRHPQGLDLIPWLSRRVHGVNTGEGGGSDSRVVDDFEGNMKGGKGISSRSVDEG